MTTKQKNDILVSLYFAPNVDLNVTEEDKEKYLLLSENGKQFKQKYPHERVDKGREITNGFDLLVHGKRLRGLTMQFWEDGVMEQTHPYLVLLREENGDPIPRFVVDFIKKEMFKGMDSDFIERLYQQIKTK